MTSSSLACSGIVGAAAAAPPCAPFSRARLRPGGPKPVRTPEFPTGIPDPSPAQQSELATSALLHERARHFLSLVAARGGLIILENRPPASSGWTPLSARGWLFMRRTAHCVPTRSSTSKGLSGPTSLSWLLSLASVRIRPDFTLHLPDAVTRMALSLPARRLAIRTHSQPPLPHTLHRSCLSEARQSLLVNGLLCFRPPSSGLSRPGALRTVPGLAAQPSGVHPENPTSSSPCVQLGCANCRRLVFCPACLLILSLLARILLCLSLPFANFWPTFVHSYASGTTPHGPNYCMLIRGSRSALTFGIACLSSPKIRTWIFSGCFMNSSPWKSATPFRLAKCFSLRTSPRNPSYHFSTATPHGSPLWATQTLLMAFSMPSFRKAGSVRSQGVMPRSASSISTPPSAN